jgi:hypothetical protein
MNGVLGSRQLFENIPQAIYVCAREQASLVTINIVNRNNQQSAQFSVAITDNPLNTPASTDWIEYEVTVGPGGVLSRTGLMINPEQYLVVLSNRNSISAVCWGVEMGDEIEVDDILYADPPPVYAVAPATSSVNEGEALTFNVSGAYIVDGTYYWTVTNSGDFSVSSGSFTITANTGSFSVTPSADLITEGAETFTASVRTGSTSGPVVAISSLTTINDTSVNPIGASPFVSGGLMTYDFQGANAATTTSQTSGSLSTTILLTSSSLSNVRAAGSGLTSLFVSGSAGATTARAEVYGLNILPTNFTWEGWIYYPAFSTNIAQTSPTVFSIGNNSQNVLAVRWTTTNGVEFRTNISNASTGQGGQTLMSTGPFTGVWQHHAITADGTNYRYYLDGALIGQTTNNNGTWGTGVSAGRAINVYTIGNWLGAPFNGTWSNAYYWNCRLSSGVVYTAPFTVTKLGMF